jgi:hypothetical protein
LYTFVLNIFIHFYKHLLKSLNTTTSVVTDCGPSNWCLIPERGKWTFLFTNMKTGGRNAVTISLCLIMRKYNANIHTGTVAGCNDPQNKTREPLYA